jgi:hypothetical protein
VVQTSLSLMGWQEGGISWVSTPWSSSKKRDGDKMVTAGDESTPMEAGSVLHLGWGKLQVLLAWRVLGGRGGGVTDERVDGGVHWFVASAGADVRGGVLALGLAPMAFGAEAQWSEGKE